MAENEGNNMYKFNLSFQQSWHPRELVRKGKKKDPLGKKLRTVPADQYYNSLLNGAPVEHIYDFVYDDNIILYNLSNGKFNMYIFQFICLLEMDEKRACK